MSCKKSTENIERARFEKLSFKEAMALKIHLAMCKNCQDYKKYSAQLEEFLVKEFGRAEVLASESEVTLSPEEKQNLIERLKHNL